MKLSQLIKEAQAAFALRGDIEVYIESLKDQEQNHASDVGETELWKDGFSIKEHDPEKN